MEFLIRLMHAFNPSSDAYLFMWAILVTGVFSLAIVIERLVYLTVKGGKKPEPFMKAVLEKVEKDDFTGALALCKTNMNSALGLVVKSGIENVNNGAERVRNAIDEAMLKAIPSLEKRTGYLAVIGNVATLLGLLGTVYGLIMSFAAVGRPGIDAAQKSELLAAGIAAAMNSTFTGLSVAISAIIVFAFLKAKTQHIIDSLDENSLRLTNSLIAKTYKTHKYHINASQLKEGVGLHVTHNNIKIFTDDKMIKEITI